MFRLAPPQWLTEQPDYPAQLSPDHVRAGLNWFVPGTRSLYTSSGPRFAASTVGGPKYRREPVEGGLLGFGSTYGTGTSDMIRAFYSPTELDQYVTILGRVYVHDNTAGGGLGRLFQVGESGAYEGLFLNSGGLSYLRDGSGGDAQYTGASIGNQLWTDFDIEHDQSATGLAATMRMNGAAVSVSTGSISSGSYVSMKDQWVSIGNRPSDSARGLNGMIKWMARYSKRLSIAQKDSLRFNPWQQLRAPSRIHRIGFVDAGLSASISESAAAAESIAQLFGATPAISESATASHSQTSSAAQSASQTDAAALADAPNASASGDYTGTVGETSNAATSQSQTMAAAGTVSEAASAGSSQGCVLGIAAAVTEASVLADSENTAPALTASISQALTLAHTQEREAFGRFILDLVENNAGSEWADETLNFSWLPGWRIGEDLPVSPVKGTVALDSDGEGFVPSLPLGQSGIMMLAKRVTDYTDDNVYLQAGTVV
jgi:hypothetical protein